MLFAQFGKNTNSSNDDWVRYRAKDGSINYTYDENVKTTDRAKAEYGSEATDEGEETLYESNSNGQQFWALHAGGKYEEMKPFEKALDWDGPTADRPKGGSAKKGPDWFDIGNKGNAAYGTAVTATDIARIAGGWARISGKLIAGAGAVGAGAGTALDIYGVYNYYRPNAGNVKARVSPAKGSLDLGVTTLGIWGGPVGEISSTVYFSIDAFYPHGVYGYASDVGQNLINSGSPIMFQP